MLEVQAPPPAATEAECCLEFFSSSHGKWIPVDIIERNAQGDVQVSANPGKWLLAKDCKRKLRARKAAGDSGLGSTIMSADAILQGKVTPSAASNASPSSRQSAAAVSSPKFFDPPMPQNFSQPPPGASKVDSFRPQVPEAGPPPLVPRQPRASANPVVEQSSPSMRQQQQQMSRQMPSLNPQAPKSDAFSNGYSQGESTQSGVRASGQATFPLGRPTAQATESASSGSPSCSKPAAQYSCPRTGKLFASFEEAVRSSQEAGAGGVESSEPAAEPTMKSGRQRNGLRYFVNTVENKPQDIRPKLEPSRVDWKPGVLLGQEQPEGQESDVKEGQRQDVGGESDSTRSSENLRPPQAAAGIPQGLGNSETIAFNLRGEPCIMRVANSETGDFKTIVVNDDGTKTSFGKNTMDSLTSSDESDAEIWVKSLSLLEIRGLVHEVGQVLLSASQLYQFHLDKLNTVGEKQNYAFFGLEPDCTDSELDKAYKKMAIRMHPDKNGGTDSAKEKFQDMKDRYETLKKRRADGEDGPGSKDKDPEDKDENGEEKRKEAYDEDDEDDAPKKEESQKMSYDPTDHDSMATTAVEMLQRLKAIEGSMETVMGKLRMHGLI